MNEKVLFKSEPSKYVKMQLYVCWGTVAFAALSVLSGIFYLIISPGDGLPIFVVNSVFGALFFVLARYCFKDCKKKFIGELTITDKRFYGIEPDGVTFDIPLNEVTDVYLIKNEFYKEGICVETVRTKIYIYYIDDRESACYIFEKNCAFSIVNFYEDCKKAGIAEVDSKESVARLVLYAKNNRIIKGEAELVDLYKKGQAYAEERAAMLSEEAKKKMISDTEKSEREEVAEQRKYIYYKGSAKRKHMAGDVYDIWKAKRDEIDEAYHAAKDFVVKSATAQYSAVAEKESSWGWQAGIANGLAGPAAGLATAMEVEMENAEIRARNEVRRQQIISNAAKWSESIKYEVPKEITSNCVKYGSIKDNADKKLVENLPQDVLFEKLTIDVENVEATATGAVRLSVKAVSEPFFIYEKVNACVDGHLDVKLLFEGETVCSTVFSLPMEGSVADECRTVLFNNIPKKHFTDRIVKRLSEKSGKYTLEFSPNNLWGMEI